MKTILILGIVLLLSFSALADINHYYKIDLLYNQGNLSYRNLAVQPSPQPLQNPEGFYVAEVVSYDNKILNLTFFAIPLTIFYDVADPETGALVDGGIIEPQQAQTNLYVPYYADAKEINIYDQELIRRLTIDISSYAKELPTKEIMEEKVRPEIRKTEIIPAPQLKTVVWFGIIAGLLLLVILILIILVKRRRA